MLATAGFAAAARAEESKLPINKASWMVGPLDLDARRLNQLPEGTYFRMSFPEPVWLLSYETEIVDDSGKPLDKDLHCHTMFKTLYTDAWKGHNGKPFKGLFSDGNTNGLRVPEGFGIFYDTDESIEIIPMFNNRNPDAVHAGMRATVDFIRDKDLEQPLKPLFSMVQSVVVPHFYLVDPGEDVRELEMQFPFDGRIHMMGVHIHPYGKSMELINESRNETVWKAVAERNEAGKVQRMPVYRNTEGYRVLASENYRMRAIYDNPTNRQQDAMAAFVIFFATDDGKMPEPPAGSAVDPANDHHH